MNLPNKLTVTRLVLVPVFLLAFILGSAVPSLQILCTVVMVLSYAVAELSDLLDGKIARKYNLVTDLGKVLDPFADTLTHVTYFLCFLSYGIMPFWCFVIIMWREFSILFVRMMLAKFANKAMPANIFGKAKTVLYAATTFLSILFIALVSFVPGAAGAEWKGVFETVLRVFFILSAVASAASFGIYAKDVLESKALSGMTR